MRKSGLRRRGVIIKFGFRQGKFEEMVGQPHGREDSVSDKDMGVIHLEVKTVCVVNLNTI